MLLPGFRDEDHPLKVVGGQHRYEAIKEALALGVNESHGIKVYFSLTPEQRLDAQLISNTVIAVPTDPYDRMQETMEVSKSSKKMKKA